jgi:solute carrier family 25 (mitochondrial phosphate transporter), member 3
MATFVVYEHALEKAYQWVDKSTLSSAAITGINLGSGLIAGVAAAIVSQPADAMLSKINKEKGESGQGTFGRLWKIARDTGLRGSFAGFRARLVMVGSMTAIQFAIYGDVKKVCSCSLLCSGKTSRISGNNGDRLLVRLAE